MYWLLYNAYESYPSVKERYEVALFIKVVIVKSRAPLSYHECGV